MATALIVLAAGQGSRMKSDLPKVLHPLGGAPLYLHALNSGRSLEPEKIVLVTGVGAELVVESTRKFDVDAEIVVQDQQLGTGHAVMQAQDALAEFSGDALVLFGDTPFMQPETLEKMVAALETHDVVVLGFEPADTKRYGRLVMDGDALQRIVEHKDASDDERAITLCNGGVTACRAPLLFELIEQIKDDNASGEYYLTDVVELARKQGLTATVVTCDEAETLGVNSRADLAAADGPFAAARLGGRAGRRDRAQRGGGHGRPGGDRDHGV